MKRSVNTDNSENDLNQENRFESGKATTFEKLVESRVTWFLALSMIILLCFVLIPILTTKLHWFVSYNQNTAFIGDTIGGIVAPLLGIVAIILTFAAFYIQYKANKVQSYNFYTQQFESKFFDLTKIHRDNVAEMELHNKVKRNVFVILRSEFQDIYEVVEDHLIKVADSDGLIKADIAYMFLFFGVGISTSPMIKEITNKYQCQEAIAAIDEKLRLIQVASTQETKYLKNNDFGDRDYKPFNGHQVRLAHYFRHLYQTVKFVESQKGRLGFHQKEYYIKILRAQMGTHELAIFFYNALSSLGVKWRVPDFVDEQTNEKVNLITKYNLLRNLPVNHFTYKLSPKKYFPRVDYEWDFIVAI
jgi:hypothetical protein